MPSSFEASRDYSKGLYSRGSRLALSRHVSQIDPGPTDFGPGTTSKSALYTKLAHAILARGHNQAVAREEAAAAAQPKPMTEFQQKTVDHWSAPKVATPRAPATPTHYAPGDVPWMPEGGDVEPRRDAGKRQAYMAGERKTAADKREQTSAAKLAARQQVVASNAAMSDFDRQRKDAEDVAESTMRNHFQGWLQAMNNPKSDPVWVAGMAAKLGVKKDTVDGQYSLIGSAGNQLIQQARLAARQRHDQQTAGARDRLRKVILEHSPLALTPDDPAPQDVGAESEWTRQQQDLLNNPDWGGGDGTDDDDGSAP